MTGEKEDEWMNKCIYGQGRITYIGPEEGKALGR